MQMDMTAKLTGPDGQVAALEPETGKLYIFVEPTRQLTDLFPLVRADEHQGARCLSIILDGDAALAQSLALTHAVVHAQPLFDQN